LILSAAVWAVICPPGWGAAALVVAAAALPPLLSWWLGAQGTAQAITTAKQIGLSTGSEINA
jgi:Na+-translocating ferredoxin:NAD+ oxidoreductase RnfD subunit